MPLVTEVILTHFDSLISNILIPGELAGEDMNVVGILFLSE
jgi:hypothetical protein